MEKTNGTSSKRKILSQSCGTSQRDHEIKAIIDQQHHRQEQNRKKLPTHSHNYPNWREHPNKSYWKTSEI